MAQYLNKNWGKSGDTVFDYLGDTVFGGRYFFLLEE